MAIFPIERPIFTIQLIHATPNVTDHYEDGPFASFDVVPHRWIVDEKVGGMDEALLSVLAMHWQGTRWSRGAVIEVVQPVDLPGISCSRGGLVSTDIVHPFPDPVQAIAHGTHLSIAGHRFDERAFQGLYYYPLEVSRSRDNLKGNMVAGHPNKEMVSALMGAASLLDGMAYASQQRFVHDGQVAHATHLLEAVGGRVARLLAGVEQSGKAAVGRGEKLGQDVYSMLVSGYLLHTDRLWLPRTWSLQDGWPAHASTAIKPLFEAGRAAAAAALPYAEHLRYVHRDIALSGHARIACKAAVRAIDQAFATALIRAGVAHLLIPSARRPRS